MPINRAAHPELFDSLHQGDEVGRPVVERRGPPPLPPSRPGPVPSPAVPAVGSDDETVAVAVRPALAPAIMQALRRAGLVVGGAELTHMARVVVIDAELSDAASAVARTRKQSSANAAIVVVLAADRSAPASVDAIRAARKSGAFACLHVPVIDEELQSIVAAAVDVGAAKAKVVSLSKKLDVDAHLASVGRISAGLTHEIANPLAIAATNLDLIADETSRMLEALDGLVQAPFAKLPQHFHEVQSELRHARSSDGVVNAIRDSKLALQRIGALLGTMRDLVGGVGSARHDPIDLLAVANEVAKRWLAHEHGGVQVTVVGSPIEANADAVLVQQILQNLTANAIHAVQAQADAHVRLHVYRTEGYAVISVRDNGPGIAPELHERVFEPFFTSRRGTGGTGLGLALCREYAMRMGADLSLWSVVGRGTCFRLTIPLG